MAKYILTLIGAGFVLFAIGCAKDGGGGGGGGTVAQTPGECVQRGNCADPFAGTQFSYQRNYDGSYYTQQDGFCGCPANLAPASTVRQDFVACFPKNIAPMRVRNYQPMSMQFNPGFQQFYFGFWAGFGGVGFVSTGMNSGMGYQNLGHPHIDLSYKRTRNNDLTLGYQNASLSQRRGGSNGMCPADLLMICRSTEGNVDCRPGQVCMRQSYGIGHGYDGVCSGSRPY